MFVNNDLLSCPPPPPPSFSVIISQEATQNGTILTSRWSQQRWAGRGAVGGRTTIHTRRKERVLQLNVFLFPPPCLPGSCRDKVTFKVMYVLLVNKRYKDQTIFATIVGFFCVFAFYFDVWYQSDSTWVCGSVVVVVCMCCVTGDVCACVGCLMHLCCNSLPNFLLLIYINSNLNRMIVLAFCFVAYTEQRLDVPDPNGLVV